MNDAERYRLARYWLDRGECPGCRSPLARVAGRGIWHTRGGTPKPVRHDVCPVSADELAALVHVGSGLVASAGVSPVGSSV